LTKFTLLCNRNWCVYS